jgi:hypothetical protein
MENGTSPHSLIGKDRQNFRRLIIIGNTAVANKKFSINIFILLTKILLERRHFKQKLFLLKTDGKQDLFRNREMTKIARCRIRGTLHALLDLKEL